MLFKSQIITSASGSVGGITASRNKGGMYFRARAIPTDPGSEFQVAVRNAQAQIAARWNDVLTQLQRDAWQVYADNVTLPNPLGDQRNVSGIAMYSRSNVIRLQVGLSIIDDGPVIFSLPTFSDPSIAAFAAAVETYDIAFSETDAWALEVGGAMLVYGSRPQNPGIKFFKGPYRFAASILGAVVAPTSPATITSPFPFADGNQLFLQTRVVLADGRLSSAFRFRGISA
ncbi:hypothetical protein LCGC14_1164220 [marine sediment metagenome]|uniref:Uncharacterized protein n=1 Tax=marine sediment metagenome TaxID=412755 RepID=A0A0F9LWT8_9ZZZZ